MTTYTIAFLTPEPDGSSLLLATVPDGKDIATVANFEIVSSGLDRDGPVTYETESGLILTNTMPTDEERIVWEGNDRGWLMDERGKTYDFAIRAEG